MEHIIIYSYSYETTYVPECYGFVYNIFICIQKYVFLLYILFYLYYIYGAYSISWEGILNIHRVHATACTLLTEAYWIGISLCIHAEKYMSHKFTRLWVPSYSICNNSVMVVREDIIKSKTGATADELNTRK